jgi:hypothetical protein
VRESTSTSLLIQQKFLLAPPLFFFRLDFDLFQEQAAASLPLLNIPLLLSCGPLLILPIASIRLPSVNWIGRLSFFSTQLKAFSWFDV